MRKIKECICDSTEKVEGINEIPFCLASLFQTMAIILICDSEQRLMMNMPTMEMSGRAVGGGKAKEQISTLDVISILREEDMMRGFAQHFQLHEFLRWFLEQDEPEDSMWYELEFVGSKWNEFAKRKSEGTE